jgi:hypothetical protein
MSVTLQPTSRGRDGQMSFMRRWAASTVVLGSLLVLANEYHFAPRDCNDSGIVWGFPFPFQRTETFARSAQMLWAGAIADGSIVVMMGVLAAFVWSSIAWRSRLARGYEPQMRTPVRSLIMVTLLVIAATAAFYVTYGNSVLRWVFLVPLLPGAITGLLLSGHGGNTSIAFIVSLTVNTGIYWLTWLLILRVIPHFRKIDGR